MSSEIITPFKTDYLKGNIYDKKLNDSIIEEIYKTEKNEKSTKQTNAGINSYQSPLRDMKNLPECMLELFNKMFPMIIPYVKHMGIKKPFSISCNELWYNINRKHAFNSVHRHVHSHFSFVYFAKSEGDDSGFLTLYNPDEGLEINHFMVGVANDGHLNMQPNNSFRWSIVPEPGTFVVFPSHIKHSVEVNAKDSDRISLAGDFFCLVKDREIVREKLRNDKDPK